MIAFLIPKMFLPKQGIAECRPALRFRIPASTQKPPVGRDPRTKYGLHPRYNLTGHHRQSLSHTSRKSILYVPGIMAETHGTIHKTQTGLEDGSMLCSFLIDSCLYSQSSSNSASSVSVSSIRSNRLSWFFSSASSAFCSSISFG